MPTLEQLFKNKDLGAGQTAEQKYAVRNANKIELSSNSPVINSTSMKALNKLRSGNGSIFEETLLEQETTGLRVLNTLSQPLLYGFESGRIGLRTTKPLADMKLAANGEFTGLPIVGKAIKSVQNISQKVTKFLGIPSLATPTYLYNDGSLEGINNIQKDYTKTLTKIKKGADGTAVGGLIGDILGGQLTDPDQLKKKAISGALGLAKGFLRDKVIGGYTPSQNNYDFNKFPGFKNGVKIVRNYGPNTQNNLLSLTSAGTTLTSFSTSLPTFVKNEGNYFDAGGSSYSSFFKPTITTVESKNFGILGEETSTFALPSKFTVKSEDSEENREFGLLKNSPFPDIEINNKINRNGKLSKGQIEKRKQNLDNFSKSKNNESSFGIGLNTLSEYDLNDEGNAVDNKKREDLDTVVLKFESVKQNKAVNFLATITGLNESFSPSWNANKFIGNPFNFYTYDGIERSVSFSFKVFSLNPNEHKAAWARVNFLSSLVYPQAFEGDAGYITAPFLRLTLGDMYKRKEGFLENLSYSFDDNTPWEIGGEVSSVEGDINMKGYVLPRVINVETTFKFIEQRKSVDGYKYYSFKSIT